MIYEDASENDWGYMTIPFAGSNHESNETLFNRLMCTVRVAVEYSVMSLKSNWPALDILRKLHMMKTPVGVLCVVAT